MRRVQDAEKYFLALNDKKRQRKVNANLKLYNRIHE